MKTKTSISTLASMTAVALSLGVVSVKAQSSPALSAVGAVLSREVVGDAIGAAKDASQSVLTVHSSRGGNKLGNVQASIDNNIRGDVKTDGVGVTAIGRMVVEDSRAKNINFRSENDIGSVAGAGLVRVSVGELAIENAKIRGDVSVATKNYIGGDIKNYGVTSTKVGSVGVRNTSAGNVSVNIRNRVSGAIRTTGVSSTVIGSVEF